MLVPLYLDHLGHSVEVIGLVIGIGGVATLVARFSLASLYRRDRARVLLVGTLVGGALSYGLAPFMPDVVRFSVAFVVNRACIGLAGGFFLARYLDMMSKNADRRRAMGYFGGIQAVGFTLTHLLVGILAELVGYSPCVPLGIGIGPAGRSTPHAIADPGGEYRVTIFGRRAAIRRLISPPGR
jgi:MFS family permease